MLQVMPTKCISTRLIESILTKDEDGIKLLIDQNIKVVSVLNNGDPITTKGENAYLDRIRLIWEKMVEYHLTDFDYVHFTEKAGIVYFAQIITAKGEHGDETIFSKGTQVFTFANGLVTEIEVTEETKVLSQAELEGTLAKIRKQRAELIGPIEPNAPSVQESGCVIL